MQAHRPPSLPINSFALRAPGQRSCNCNRPQVELTPDGHIQAFTSSFDIDIAPRCAADCARIAAALHAGAARLLVGDESQARSEGDDRVQANLLLVEVSFIEDVVRAYGSLVGLPPLYVAHAGAALCLAAPGLCHPWLHFNPRSVDQRGTADLLQWGYTIEHRTLYAGIQLAAAGSIIELRHGQPCIHKRTLAPAKAAEAATLGELLDRQAAAFDSALARMDTSNAFLSLSGGLDSRTILAGLCSKSRPVTCVTLAGAQSSLDLQNAVLACRIAAIPHLTVVLEDEYFRRLPELFLKAARLTGGANALSQTLDIFLYEQLGGKYNRRISGNLGNQVGRAGVERLSSPSVDRSILSGEMLNLTASKHPHPWFVTRMRQEGFANVLFQEEVPFSSAANYSLGSAFAVQLTPYADRELIETATNLHERTFQPGRPPSTAWLRARDLRHRCIGPPRRTSFQRRYLGSTAGSLRRVPVNWGWYPDGHLELQSFGVLTRAASAVAMSRILPARYWDLLLSPLGIHPRTYWDWGLSETRFRECFRDFAFDIAGGSAARESGVFNNAKLGKLMERYFDGEPVSRDSIVFALEVASALAVSRDIARQSTLQPH